MAIEFFSLPSDEDEKYLRNTEEKGDDKTFYVILIDFFSLSLCHLKEKKIIRLFSTSTYLQHHDTHTHTNK
jgi:hypothetical protein